MDGQYKDSSRGGGVRKRAKLPLKYVELLLNKIWTDATNCGLYKLPKHLHNLTRFAYSTCIHYGHVATCSQINAGNSAVDGINHVADKTKGVSRRLYFNCLPVNQSSLDNPWGSCWGSFIANLLFLCSIINVIIVSQRNSSNNSNFNNVVAASASATASI